MNYTIGGNVSMSKKKYYIRPSGLVQLREHISRFVSDVMNEDHMIGPTELTTQVMQNIAEEIFIDVCRIHDLLGDPSTIYLGDEHITNSQRKFYYKRNKYNLNLLGEKAKIKVWLGVPARIARENFLLAQEKYPDYHSEFHVNTIERNMYRIECYKLIRGFTLDDMLRKNPSGVWYDLETNDSHTKEEIKQKFIDDYRHKNKDGCLVTSMIESFFTFVTRKIHHTRYGKNVYYPNDCNPGNFVLDYDSEQKYPYNLINMDYDHMIITNPKHMAHNVTWQFFSRIFDIESLDDESASVHLVNWRNEHDLFEEVEKFKIRYFDSANIDYNSEIECFNYDITSSTLNGSEFLMSYVSEKKEKLLKEISKGAKYNDLGKELIFNDSNNLDGDEDDLE